MARRDGLIGLRYDFIGVTLNGKLLGVYALEEHFDKGLIEFNRRREGPILRFDEALWWDERQHFGEYDVRLREETAIYDMERELPGFGTYYAMPLITYEAIAIRSDPALFGQFQVGLNLLEGFRSGRYATGEVFDIEQLARYLALCDLFGTNHSMVPNQVRLYCNPITARLEPIAYDLNAGFKLTTLLCALRHDDFIRANGEGKVTFIRQLLADEAFYEAYVRHLDLVSRKQYLDQALDELHGQIKRNLAIIHIDEPGYRFEPEILYKNQRYIQMMLDPLKGMDAYLRRASGDSVELELAAIQSLPVEVLGVELNGTPLAAPTQRTVLRPKVRKEPSVYQTVRFALPAGHEWSDQDADRLAVRYRLLGTERQKTTAVYPWPHEGDANAATMGVQQAPTVDRFSFVHVDEAAGTINIRPGKWTLTESLIIPAGYRVHCAAGTRLDLQGGARIVSQSPLIFHGTQERPIVIESSDGTGQGLAVLSAGERSQLRHVRFHNLLNPSSGAWTLTGAVTFYESPVELIDCQFENNRCEDGLNLVRSEFIMDRCVFRNCIGDALDADFSNGRMTDSVFANSGNDAVDVCGSVVQMTNVRILSAGDKGLSAGENSQVTGRKIYISAAAIAVASKDNSVVRGDEFSINDSTYGFAAYQKKQQFGPARIEINGAEVVNVKTLHKIEKRSSAVVNDRRYGADEGEVYEQLYVDKSATISR